MKFSCTQENLSQGLLLVSRVASRAGNLPILSHVHIKATPEAIVLKTTNLEVGMTYQIRGQVQEEGEFTVPAKLLTDYVLSLPKDRVDVELKAGALQLACASHTTVIKGLPAADFPLIPEVEAGVKIRVATPALAEALSQVLFTISPTETRPEISGALLSCQGDRLILAGTDGYRLAEKILLAQVEGQSAFRAVAPLRALQELQRICEAEKDESATATLVVSENQFAVTFTRMEFVSRLIASAPYPDYRAIMPERFGSEAVLSRAEFIGAIKAAGLFSKAGIYDIGVEIDPDAGNVKVAALNSQTGEHQSVLPASGKGGLAKIAFNWKYLLEGVQAIETGSVLLKATDSSAPSLIVGENATDYFYIVMPIKE